jgi:molecular chaperone DnaJ
MAERGSDLKIRLPLTLEEISVGAEKNIKIKRWVACDTCHGTGAAGTSGFKKCNVCNGSGEIRNVQRSVFGQFINIAPCTHCGGTGQIISEPCLTCRGEGRLQADDTVKVNIPPGVETGNYIPMRGRGNAGRRGGEAGDLIVVIEEKEHPVFVRNGNNVLYHLTISFPDAALGIKMDVPTLYGDQPLKIEPGTQPGTSMIMRGMGIPNLNSYGKGDQVVFINIQVPTSLSSKEKSSLKELSESQNFKPKKHKNEKDKDFFEKVKDAFF